MKVIRASKKVEKAIDAMIDLQQDFMTEIEAANVVYEVGRILDTLNSISAALDLIS